MDLLLTEGQASDHRGAALTLPKRQPANDLIADRGYGTEGVRRTQRPLQGPTRSARHRRLIPSTRSRKQPTPHDPTLQRQRHRIENMVARPKDCRRIALRNDRCAHAFFAAITLAAIITFWTGN